MSKREKVLPQIQAVRNVLVTSEAKYTLNKEAVGRCINDFDEITTSLQYKLRSQKVINDFFTRLSIRDGAVVHAEDLEAQLQKDYMQKKKNIEDVKSFAEKVKVKCFIQGQQEDFFSFYDVPEVLQEKKYNSKDYQRLIKYLNKVRMLYLTDKLEQEIAKPEYNQNDEEASQTEESMTAQESDYDEAEYQGNLNEPAIRIESITSLGKVVQQKPRQNNFAEGLESKLEKARAKSRKEYDKVQAIFDKKTGLTTDGVELKKVPTLEEMVVTDEDFVSFDYLDRVLQSKKDKVEEKFGNYGIIKRFIDGMIVSAAEDAIKKMGGGTDGVKKKIRQCFIAYQINEILEQTHSDIVRIVFGLNMLYNKFYKRGASYDNPEDFRKQFKICTEVKSEKDHYHAEFQMQLQKEMGVFNGFVVRDENDGETASSHSYVSKGSIRKSVAPTSPSGKGVQFEDKGDREHRDTLMLAVQQSGKEGDENMPFDDESDMSQAQVGDNAFMERKKQEQEEEMLEKLKVEETRIQDQKDAAMQEFFKEKDIDGNYTKNYDAKKKYGTIEGEEQLLYDDITTSYKLNLPPDYYMRQIKKQLPDPSDGQQWFLRPHHIESLTNHARSIKCDFLNTHYYSHYNMQHGVEKPFNAKVDALEKLRAYMQQLKIKQRMTANHPTISINVDEVEARERRYAEMNGVYEDLEEFLKDKTPENEKALVIAAYEAINTLERMNERELLNSKRNEEYEKFRKPTNKWYELKSKTFGQEVIRNRVSLKPDNENDAYLSKLLDRNIY